MGIDIETYDPNLKATGPSVRTGGFICGVSFALEDGPSYYLPIRHKGGDNLDEQAVLHYLRDQARRFRGIIVGANFNYDLDFLGQAGVTFPRVLWQRDVQIADPLINELHESYSLEAIAQRWGFPGKEEPLLRQALAHYRLRPGKADLWMLPARFVGPYAEQDAALPLQILRRQERELDALELWGVYDLESALQPVLLAMKRQGVRIDEDRLAQLEGWTREEEGKALQVVYSSTGVRIPVGAAFAKKPLVAVMEHLGIKLDTTPSGQARIDKDLLADIDHPVAAALRHAREVSQLRTTFIDGTRDHIVNGRIHCTFNQLRRERETGESTGARFGRTSSEHPNMQNQPNPKRHTYGARWRSIYVPDTKDQLWLSADYSQQEPRMLTHFAELCRLPGAEASAERYRTDPLVDNHSMMTRAIHPHLTHVDDKDPDFQIARNRCKQIFLGLCYGMGGGKLARDLGLPTQMKELSNNRGMYEAAGPEAQRLLDLFNQRIPFVKGLAELTGKTATKRGYIVTLSGRRCHFPKKPDGSYDWAHKAINRLIQGSSADQTKRAMVEIFKAGLPLQLQVHDEVDASITDLKQAKDIVHIMRTCVELRVPSRVDASVGPSWGEAKGVEL